MMTRSDNIMKPEFVSIYRQQEKLLARVKIANHFIDRLRGLMFYQEWPDFDGLLLYPCNSIHMFWMWFPLDILYLDQDGRIIHQVTNIQPNQIGPTIRKASYVLEFPVGRIAEHHLSTGQILWWESQSHRSCMNRKIDV